MTDVPPNARLTAHPLLCVVCRAHLGWWPEDDPRCPQCRYSGQEAEQ
jgi:predicted amidophosphoribosyltransferase